MSFEYKTYPYTFGPDGKSIADIIKQFNHQNMNPKVVDLMVQEFNRINHAHLPPKMGHEVKVPVLLPFCEKHEANQERNSQMVGNQLHNDSGGAV